MKKIFFFAVALFISTNVSAQKYSVGVSYSSLLKFDNNYRSGYIFSIGGDYEVLHDVLSAGVNASLVLTDNFLIEELLNHVNERSFNLSFNLKYYPVKLYLDDSFSIKPFVSVGLGAFLIYNMDIPGGTPYCNDHYHISTEDYLNTYIGSGILILPGTLSFIFAVKYFIRNPELNIEKPNCTDPIAEPDSYSQYSKRFNLNMLLFSLGVRITF